MKKALLGVVMAIAMTFSGFAFATPAAHASEPSSGSEIVNSFSSASSTTHTAASAVNGVSISSSVKVVSYIQAHGATKAQMHGKKIRLKKAMTLWTSYFNVAGQQVWHWKTYPKGKVFVKSSDGWFHDPVCWNKVKIKTKKVVPQRFKLRGKIKVVKSFTFTATATSTVTGDASAKAHAWCKTSTSAAEAFGTGTGHYFASATATGSGRTWAIAKARASSSAAGKLWLKAKSKTNVQLTVKTQAEGTATADATAKAVCSEIPPPPVTPTYSCDTLHVTQGDNRSVTVDKFETSQNLATFTKVDITWGDGASTTSTSPVGLTHSYGADGTYTIKATAHFDVNGTDKTATSNGCQQVVTFNTPPPPVAKPVVEACQINMVLENNSYTCTVTGTVAAGHTATLISSARNGGTITSNKNVTVSGSFTVKVGYVAPGEIPPANTQYGIAAGKDRIDFVLNQDDGQQATDTTNQFDIVQPTPDPK
jgi:hypothetical protein